MHRYWYFTIKNRTK